MSEPIVPIIRLPVRPENVIQLDHDHPLRVGGVRQRTTIYIVTEADMPGANQNVATVTVPVHATVELRLP